VLRPMVRLYRWAFNKKYEEAFDSSLLSAIRLGDTIWDIGAHVGVYTVKFAEAVGPQGQVVAFEPSPQSVEILRKNVSRFANVRVENVALSDSEGDADFFIEPHGVSAVDGLSKASATFAARKVTVQVRRGDCYLHMPPSVIKLDVEGLEPEVIAGLKQILKNEMLRAVFVEVHFLTLAKRGRRMGPTELTIALRAAGFRTRWTDPSHLAATR